MQSARLAVGIGLVVLIVIGVALFLSRDAFYLSPEQMTEWLRAQGRWAPVAIVALMVLHCVIPFPAELLAICAGAVFGVMFGTALIWVGAMLGAVISFGLSRWLGRTLVVRLLPERNRAALDRWSTDQGTLALLISRFIPILAFNLINYGAGLTTITWRTFLWTTAIGILPITMLSVWLGSKMRYLDWTQLLILSVIGITLACAGHVLVRRYGAQNGGSTKK